MARARSIKPGIFKNEELGTIDPIVTLLFIGLWTLADRRGVLENRPLRIKAELFPYRSITDISGYLTVLQQLGFIVLYTSDQKDFIQVINFKKHQHPHVTEKDSEFPEYSDSCSITVQYTLSNRAKTSESLLPITESLLLNPDSLNPDSLTTESLKLTRAKKTRVTQKPEVDENLQAACRETWRQYAQAFFIRYNTDPVRNATVSAQLKNFVKRIGFDESPQVAAHYLQNNASWYVTSGHSVGALLKDAEKLRTEWATGRTMTATRARQHDQSQANAGVVAEAEAILERMKIETNT